MDEQLFTALESADFAAEVGVQSGMNQFLAAVVGHPAFEAIARAAKERGVQGSAEIFQRIVRLTEERIDVRYEHPHDTALAAYLVLLSTLDREIYVTALNAVAGTINTWWAARIVTDERRATESASSNTVLSGDGQPAGLPANTSSWESFMAAASSLTVTHVLRAGTYTLDPAETTCAPGLEQLFNVSPESANALALAAE